MGRQVINRLYFHVCIVSLLFCSWQYLARSIIGCNLAKRLQCLPEYSTSGSIVLTTANRSTCRTDKQASNSVNYTSTLKIKISACRSDNNGTPQDTELSIRTPQRSPGTVAEAQRSDFYTMTKNQTIDLCWWHKNSFSFFLIPTEIQQVISKQKHYMCGAFQ